MKIKVETNKPVEFIDVTDLVQTELEKKGEKGEACLLNVPHTTAGITINEGADPDVVCDIIRQLERLARGDYRHGEGNGPAHFKASLMGSFLLIPLYCGPLKLGTWQRIFLCEFDGPRSRRIELTILGRVGGS